MRSPFWQVRSGRQALFRRSNFELLQRPQSSRRMLHLTTPSTVCKSKAEETYL
jgi:hypothetical protein